MAVTPINVARVTSGLRSFNLLNTVSRSQLDLFRIQNQLATGVRFHAPSDDPTRATLSSKLDGRVDIVAQLRNNLRDVNATLTSGEAAMQDAVDKVIEMQTLTSEAVNDTLSADERAALRVVVDSALEQLVSIGNRKHLDTHLFSGHYGNDQPFEWTADGVIFRGDNGRLTTTLDTDLSQDSYTISGMEFFNATSKAVQGIVDLDPQVTLETRLSDLLGPTGTGIALGQIVVGIGSNQTEIDLTGADTVGDVIDKLNADLPATMQASLDGNSIRVQASGGDTFTITDAGGGRAAAQLGIFNSDGVTTALSGDLNPRVTSRTELVDLFGGTGAALNSGITIRNGERVAQIDFTSATTVEDVLNRINHSDIGVLARISADGATIEVLNRISGADLRIEERGGNDATLLGIRSMHSGTKLADLNDGLGVDSVEGDDMRITTADGTQIDVDVNDLDLETATLADLIGLLNAAGGGAVTAALNTTGNGIVITDNTAGAGTLSIERANISPTIDSLGLTQAASGGRLVGADVNPIRVDSPFTALLELRDALAANDTRAITAAGTRLHRNLDTMLEVQGRLAAKANQMLTRSERVEDEATAIEVLRSDVRDVDLSEALVRFQQVQTALQANLVTSKQILSLSLLDYLQ
jgi:flagellar hook-associated protein 3 FlgL